MKKMFIVALVMSFALAACGGKKQAPANPTPEGSAAGSDMGSDAAGSDMGSDAPDATGGDAGSGM